MRGSLAPEKPQERIPRFAEGAEPLPLPARVLPRDHANVARECLPVWKSGGVTHKDVRRQRGNGSDARMGYQQRGSRMLVGDVLDSLVEPIDLLRQVLIQHLELAAAMRGVGRQRQR